MSRTWLLVDANNLMHRMFWAMGQLELGATYGFLKEVLNLQEQHGTKHIVFAFDSRESVRKSLYPAYKSNRNKERTEEDHERSINLRNEMVSLKSSILQEIGFSNILQQRGYEADDILASVVQYSLRVQDSAIICSSDQDLYQLIEGDRTTIWKNGNLYQENHFGREYGIHPCQWHVVKAMAGCVSDCVEGVRGVGEKTACKYLLGKLPATHKAYQNIEASKELILKNQKLVKLPYPGTNKFTLYRDEVSISSWKKVLTKLGMKSLLERV